MDLSQLRVTQNNANTSGSPAFGLARMARKFTLASIRRTGSNSTCQVAIKTDTELDAAGFTDSGTKRYKNTTAVFCDELFNKSVALGDRDKADDAPREVTHEHVRSAATELSRRSSAEQSRLQIFCQVGEYVCSAGAGVGAGKLDTQMGILTFGGSLAIGVILFVVRNIKAK